MNKNNKIISIDSDDDDDNYNEFISFLNEDTKRKTEKTISDIEILGNDFLSEIDKKRKIKNIKKEKYVSYILKHSNEYDRNELMSYEISDIVQIYTELKEKKQFKIKQFLKFLFNF